MTDAIVGAVTNYTAEHIRLWLNSIKRSGFKGSVILMAFDTPTEIVEDFKRMGVDWVPAVTTNGPFNIVVERFRYIPELIRSAPFPLNSVILTDVRDVVFQTDPSPHLARLLNDHAIVASSEGIRYKDEPWGRDNVRLAFGQSAYEEVKDKVIANAGVIAGKADAISHLSSLIYRFCRTATSMWIPGGGGPDQAAYNLITQGTSLMTSVNFTTHSDEWAAQLGTTGPQVQTRWGQHVVEELPTINAEGVVVNAANEPYPIVHQYDRVPEWKQKIIERFQ